MLRTAIALALAIPAMSLAGVGGADADRKTTAYEARLIARTLQAHGCYGGRYEVEDDGSYEVDDALCRDGREYDIRLYPNFVIHSIKRD